MDPMRVSFARAICLATAFAAPSAAAGQFRFVDAGSSSAGAAPAGIALVDLDHDGRLDILAANDTISTVSVLLGQGTLQFAPPVAYPSAFQGRIFHHPQPLVIGDFNGDGEVDYAVTSQYGGPFHVSVSLGTGNGQFLGQVVYEVGICPTSVAAVDTNHDDKLDLIVNNFEGGSISVLLGNGDGTFQPHAEFAAGGSPVSNIAADFNGDGHADIALVGTGGPPLTVLAGLGDGQFSAPTSFAGGSNPRSLAAGDFDRDGNLDLALANGTGASISVLRGYGDGSFAPAVAYAVSGSGWVDAEPNSIVTADLDRDGNLDLAVADFRLNAVELFRGNPNGILDAVELIPVDPSPSTIAAADFNGDGSPDLALLHYESGSVRLLLNDGIFEASFEQ